MFWCQRCGGKVRCLSPGCAAVHYRVCPDCIRKQLGWDKPVTQ
jgi:hypothetical protein